MIAAPRPWSAAEKLGYGAHGLVWWGRRLTGDSSRRADAKQVAEFLLTRKVWLGNAPLATVSERGLKRLDIERHFWWMNESQIVSLAETIRSIGGRWRPSTPEQLEVLVYGALFGNRQQDL